MQSIFHRILFSLHLNHFKTKSVKNDSFVKINTHMVIFLKSNHPLLVKTNGRILYHSNNSKISFTFDLCQNVHALVTRIFSIKI